jgi:hypothetical protein
MASDNKPRIVMVRLVNEVQFLGVSGKQIAPTMGGGLELTETTKGVAVRSSQHKGKVYVVFNANIAHIQYDEGES